MKRDSQFVAAGWQLTQPWQKHYGNQAAAPNAYQGNKKADAGIALSSDAITF